MPGRPRIRDTPTRVPALGYALAAAAAALWALNGSLARFLLDDGVSPAHLSQIRASLSFLLLAAVLAVVAPRRLRVRRADAGRLAWLGIGGLAAVHATYFLAIDRIEIGVALVIQYLGPLLVLLWLALAHGRRLPRALWAAVALSVLGCVLVVGAYRAGSLDAIGLLAALGAAVAFAIYLVAAERAGHRYPADTTLVWASGFAALFWLLVRPPWTFPWDVFAGAEQLALGLGVVVAGTLLPFLLMFTAVRHVPAPRAAVVATLEPVLASLIAWPVHGEVLAAPQVAGGLLVVGAVVWVQRHRPVLEQELVPPYRSRGGARRSIPGTRFRLPNGHTIREDGPQRHGTP